MKVIQENIWCWVRRLNTSNTHCNNNICNDRLAVYDNITYLYIMQYQINAQQTGARISLFFFLHRNARRLTSTLHGGFSPDV